MSNPKSRRGVRPPSLDIGYWSLVIPRKRRDGFALLITITLLAFLVLLLVSLAALTRVETQVASNNQELSQARQNALMALNIALGELQKAAGPDQRSTAPAALGDGATAVTAAQVADNGLVPPVNGSRYWTGVWGNKASPESLFTTAPQPVLLRWLVSGNENTPAPTITAAGQITAPAVAATMAFNPAQPIIQQDGSALSATTTAATALSINARPAALLLGSKTAGTDPLRYVAAPLVEITSTQVAGLAGTSRIGRYAWWIGDEGVKAKYNLSDPYIAPNSDPSITSRDRRYRVLAAQRNGIERLAAFGDANYPLVSVSDPDDPLYTGVGNTLTPAGIHLAAPAVDPVILKNHVHDLTTYSYGVLSNSQFGGLRRDLTFHLDPRSGDTFLDGRNILPDGATPASAFPGSKYTARASLFSETAADGGLGFTTLNVSPRLGPKWDQLKSFYRIAYDHPVDLEIQPAVDVDVDPVKVQAAITPVILETRFLFALKSGPSIDTSIILILGNPYTRPLKARSGLNFRTALHPNNYSNTRQDSREWGVICNYIGPNNPTATQREITGVFTRYLAGDSNPSDLWQSPPLQRTGNPDTNHHPNYYPLLKFAPTPTGDGPPDPDPGYPGLLDNVLFQIPPGRLNLAPGEAKAYKFNPDPAASLPNQTIDGVVFQVKPLQEMANSIPTYFTHACDPRFTNDASLFPSGLFTGAAMPANTEFRVGLTLAAKGGMDFILTVPGKPASVLQSVGPYVMPTTASQNGGVPNTQFLTNVFGSSRSVVGAGRSLRVFGNSIGTYVSGGDSLMATHAETSLLGSFQAIKRFDTSASSGSGARILLRTATFTLSAATFTNTLDPSTATQGAWGQGYAGSPTRLSPNGKFILNDVPAAALADDIPVLSLAQLQHLDLTADDEALGTAAQPAYALGNSRYNRLVSRSASRTDPQDNNRSLYHSNTDDTSSTALGDSPRWYAGFVPDLPKRTLVRRYDLSYLLNASLWDDVFFSTVRPAAGSDGSPAPLAPPPANRRLVYAAKQPLTLGQLRGANASAAIPTPASLGPGESGQASAAQMLINGSFNVNSTSTQAWIALLSGLRGLGVNGVAATADRTPVPLSIRQSPALVNDTSANPFASENTYTGFRSLTDAQIASLATEIVTQVKARGPFLSLSQFVNRNLTPAAAPGDPVADTGLSGALQQAIDRTGLNTFLNTGTSIPRASAARDDGYPDEAVMPVGNTSGISTYMGVPGWLTQASLLQPLAPVLSARSDTFVIRTYGEVVDPVNSPAAPAAPVVKGRAWCEAVVQRLPDYVDTTQRPTLHPALANTQNQNFGRRFHIVSFRWLSPDDI